MAFTLPPLPFAREALQPFMSGETLDYHHGKHHKSYVDKTNALVEEAGLGQLSLLDVIHTAKERSDLELFNQSAQIWNHNFFWQCLTPSQGEKPSGQLAELIDEAFGSLDGFIETFSKEAADHFASGYAWLVLEGEKLAVTSYHDADTPIVRDVKPLFTLDVWEHAYYIDRRNDRAAYLDQVLRNIVNWEFVAQNLDGNGASRADQPGAKAMAEVD